jgi:hypothetical protein
VAKTHISKKTRLTSFLDSLTDKEFVPSLRYFEFRDVYHSNTHRNFLDFLTKRRPQLDMVFGWGSKAELIRDMSRVSLSLVPKRDVPSSGTCTSKEKTETGDVNAAWSDVALGLTPRQAQTDDTDDDKSDWEGILKNKKKNARLICKIGKQMLWLMRLVGTSATWRWRATTMIMTLLIVTTKDLVRRRRDRC